MGADIMMAEISCARARPENWPGLFYAYLSEVAQREFEWGRHDCVLFASGWLERLGYEEVLAGLPAWVSALSAARAMRGAGRFDETVSERMKLLGCPQILTAYAQRGDMALVKEGRGRHALGIVDGNKVACPAQLGLVMLPLNSALAVWRC
jgi:hypothetical protein